MTETFITRAPGFFPSALHRSFDGAKVTMYAQWESYETYQAMRRNPAPSPPFEEALTIAGFEPCVHEVVQIFSPGLEGGAEGGRA